MAKDACVASGGVVHYTTGAAGQSLDHAPLYPGHAYVEKYDGDNYGYSVIDVNATAMRLQWFWNTDDSLQDDVTLLK